jgi:hypothetical protein
MSEEKEKLIQEINVEETINIKLTSTLNETTRIAGELRVNAETLETDDELKSILSEGSKALKEFNRKINNYMSKR